MRITTTLARWPLTHVAQPWRSHGTAPGIHPFESVHFDLFGPACARSLHDAQRRPIELGPPTARRKRDPDFSWLLSRKTMKRERG